MASIFNGTTITMNSKPFVRIQSLKKGKQRKEVEVTGAEDSEATYEKGIPADSVDVEVLGAQTVADDEEGAFAVTWKDGTTDTWANAAVFSVQENGTKDGAISRTYTIKKVPAA